MSTRSNSSNEAYTLTMSATEIDRLVGLARHLNEHAKDGFRRAGLKAGDVAIDVGCGALGALPALAEVVGPTGRVAGFDQSAESLDKARQVLDQRGIANVELIQGNINSLSPQSLFPPGPFDVAFCRLFLTHQTDVRHTLRQIAALVRPGGHIIAHEYLCPPHIPQSDPDVPEINTSCKWFYEAMARAGASPDVPRQFHGLCHDVGLREVSIRGFFAADMFDTAASLRMVQASVVGFQARIIQYGIATEDEVAAVLTGLAQASEKSFQALFTSVFVELVAQVPDNPQPLT